MDDFIKRPKRPQIDMSQPPTRLVEPDFTRPRLPVQGLATVTKPEPSIIEETLPTPTSSSARPKLKLRMPRDKKEWAIVIITAVLLLGGIGFSVYWFVIRDAKPVASVQPEPEPEPEPEPPAPTTEASKLSGRQVEFAINDRPVYAVQIENSPDARPQSGLREADVITEAVAEGGITRFNAIFHDNIPANIGPIRSLRPYYIDWFWPFDAAIVHAGGSPEALSDVKNLGLKDLDHSGNGGSFRRVTNRYAPHNLYSTGQTMLDLMSKKGYTSSAVASLTRKEPTPDLPPTANTVNLKISSNLYNVAFTYDKASNSYKRTQGGSPHLDAESGQQIAPNVIVVPVLTKGIHPDRVHTQYGTTGSGKVFVFQDGVVTEGTWTKTDRKAQWQLKDAAGNPIALNAGQTWFTIIDSAASVTYKP